MNEIEFTAWVEDIDQMLQDLGSPAPHLLVCPYLTDQEGVLAARELQRRGHDVKVLPVRSARIR